MGALRLLCALIGLLLVLAVAPGAMGAPTLRVRGSAHFDAVRVRHGVQGFEVTGVLSDDMNQPIKGAVLTMVGPADVSGCDNAPPKTDEQGRFCLVTSEFSAGHDLLFEGDSFFDAAQHRLQPSLDKPTPKIAVETSSEWPLAMPTHQIMVTLLDVPLGSRPHVGIELIREATVISLVAPEPVDPSAPFPLSAATTLLPKAGVATLRATLLSGTRTTLATQEVPLTLVSAVSIAPHEVPTMLRSEDAFTASFHVETEGDPLATGWVELLADGRSVGLGPVREGKASVSGTLESARERVVQFSAQYVPEYPWFKGARPATFTVQLLGPLPWAHVPWALLALGATLWVVRTWRRPARLPNARQPTAAVNVGVTIVGQASPTDGWEGVVVDAHTQSPVAGARVLLRVPSLADESNRQETLTDERGRFMLHAVPALPEGARLIVQAEHYSLLKQPLPSPCSMKVGLSLRRRALLSVFQGWASRHTQGALELTPQAVAREARRFEQRDVESWATDVESAVFGPTPPGPEQEADLTARLPTADRSPSRGR